VHHHCGLAHLVDISLQHRDLARLREKLTEVRLVGLAARDRLDLADRVDGRVIGIVVEPLLAPVLELRLKPVQDLQELTTFRFQWTPPAQGIDGSQALASFASITSPRNSAMSD